MFNRQCYVAGLCAAYNELTTYKMYAKLVCSDPYLKIRNLVLMQQFSSVYMQYDNKKELSIQTTLFKSRSVYKLLLYSTVNVHSITLYNTL